MSDLDALKRVAREALERKAKDPAAPVSAAVPPPQQVAQISLDAEEDQLLNVVREWIELLAQKRYDEAFQMTYHPPGDHWAPHWSGFSR